MQAIVAETVKSATPKPQPTVAAEQRPLKVGAWKNGNESAATSPCSDADEAACKCGGKGWLLSLPVTRDGKELWNQAKPQPCTQCETVKAHCGLTDQERKLTFADIHTRDDDAKGYALALRVSAGLITDTVSGFCAVWGGTGNAKSLWAKAIIAEFVRRGIQARYAHAKAIESSLFGGNESLSSQATKELYMRCQVLVIDEMDKINWGSEWVSSHMSEILMHRHDRAGDGSPTERQVTIMVAQYNPIGEDAWCPDYLQSRMMDGQFAHPWPDNIDAPDCATNGIIEWPLHVDLPDFRPMALPRMAPRQVNPATGEVIA